MHGSLALGGYTPGRSDVDLLGIVERSLTDEELAELEELVVRSWERVPSGVVGVDFRVITSAVAAAPTESPPLELYVGLDAVRAPEVERRVACERDVLVELSIVRAGGRGLLGPEPSEVVGEVPDAWVVAYGDEVLARWQQRTADTDNARHMVLGSCRIWQFAAERIHCSKEEAARWTLARDPSLAAVDAALRHRAGDPDVEIAPADIATLLARVRGELARSAG